MTSTTLTVPTSRSDSAATSSAAQTQPTAHPLLEHRTGRVRRLGPGRPIPFGWLLGPAILVAVWTIGSATGFIDPRTLPAPSTIGSTIVELWSDGRLPTNILASLRLAAVSLAIGVGAGVVLALVSGLSRWGESLIDGPIQIKRAIPTLAIIPLAIMWFGIGDAMKIIIISTSVLIPVYINTHAQLRGVDIRHVELAQTVGLSRWSFIRRVALPGAVPGFFTGLRLAVTISWLALVVVEQVNATEGIGYLMNQARLYGQLEIVVVGLVVYAVFGLLGDTVVRTIERRALSWRKSLGS